MSIHLESTKLDTQAKETDLVMKLSQMMELQMLLFVEEWGEKET